MTACLSARLYCRCVTALSILIALACLPPPAEAQIRAKAIADVVCASPPMAQDSLDRLKRRSDYMGLMERLAHDCPDVAMLFMEFSVGSIDSRAKNRRSPSDHLIGPLAWPAPSDRNY